MDVRVAEDVVGLPAAEPQEVRPVTVSPHRPDAPGITPGPWTFDQEQGMVVGADDSIVLAYEDVLENDADARLIAAAPDLYEALRVAEGYIKATIETYRSTFTRGGDMVVLSQVRAALARVTGEAMR